METMNGDIFIDILEDRRKTSDFNWAMKPWNVPPCRYSQQRTPEEIKQQIFNDKNVQYLIKQISTENDQPEDQTKENVMAILNEMSHDFNFGTIRFFGFVLSKFMKRVYRKILVNKKGIEKIGNTATQYPILFLPMHRSYSDFLLVSYVCFYFNLPVPIIAAGLDFLGLKSLTSLLRGAGAFFIRRSFVDDHLYREIFTKYVQEHIQGCEYPMEFFIEGTRSRTAKSLVPKLGMLQAILELYFNSKIPDITIVPISISYDRTLEETLYAYELLGVPKPKESTRGLIKARKILSDDFGNVYIRFGEQISARDYFRDYDRSIHNLHPRNMSITFKEEYLLARNLANHIVCMHQCNLILSPFPLICLIISHTKMTRQEGIHLNHLIDLILWLEELIRRTGATIYYDGNLSDVVHDQIALHSNIVSISKDSMVSLKENVIKYPTSVSQMPRLNSDTIKHAIPAIFAYHYGNQALQLLIHLSMICTVLGSKPDLHIENNLFIQYQILRKLLCKEFVFEESTVETDFAHAISSLKEDNILKTEDSKLLACLDADDKIKFFQSLIIPFLDSYHIICHYLLQKTKALSLNCKSLAHECQAEIESKLIDGTLSNYQCLSLDIVNNCISLLVCQHALYKIHTNKEVTMKVNHPTLANILIELEMFVPSCKNKCIENINFPLHAAKL